MEKVTWYIPRHKPSEGAIYIFDSIRQLLRDALELKFEFGYFNEGQPAFKQMLNLPSSVAFVSVYEALFLVKHAGFQPLFRLKMNGCDGLIICEKDQAIEHITDLRDKSVLMPIRPESFNLNPVILYILKNCPTKNGFNRLDGFTLSEAQLNQLFGTSPAILVCSDHDFAMLPEKEQKRLKILRKFPLFGEYLAVAGSQNKIIQTKDFQQRIGTWLKNYTNRDDNYYFLPPCDKYFDLLIEALDGLGITLKEYVEQADQIYLRYFTNGKQSELAALNEKYQSLHSFNEKLVAMYKEVRDSRDRLIKEMETANENSVLFLKDGTIIGVSRGLLNWLRCSRPEIIGKEIGEFFKPNLNKSLKELIQQVDYGLIRSFGIKIQKRDGQEESAKMDFSIVELQDSKVILGMVTKRST